MGRRREWLIKNRFIDFNFFGEDATWPVFAPINGIMISGGAGKDISFELDCVSFYGCKVILFDPSETGLKTVVDSASTNTNIEFHQLALSNINGFVEMLDDESLGEGSLKISDTAEGRNVKRVKSVCLSDWIKSREIHNIDMLKLDIEGYEYQVLEDLLTNKIFVKQIVVEFHDFFTSIDKDKTVATIKKMKSEGYYCVGKYKWDYYFLHKSSLSIIGRVNARLTYPFIFG
jgi:FkbM family methyltransferase